MAILKIIAGGGSETSIQDMGVYHNNDDAINFRGNYRGMLIATARR
jgi:hypothetical protein